MKNLFVFSSLLFFMLFNNDLKAQTTHDIKVPSKIKEVTVFLTGAEVYRETKINIKKGRNKLIFTGISSVLDQKSIQFSSENSIYLVSVSSEMDYISIYDRNPEIVRIQDSIVILDNKIQEIDNEKRAYEAERILLEKNNQIKGNEKNLTVDELKSMATFYRTRMMEINKIVSEYNKKTQKYQNQKYFYNLQLNELNYKESAKSNQIIVIVDSESNQEINSHLKYIVSNCGWQANYDLAAKDISGKITLDYKAKVYNDTGNDWENINLILSTSNPNLSASAPDLQAWYINSKSVSLNDDQAKKGYIVPQNRAYEQYYQNAFEPQMSQNLDGLTFTQWNGAQTGNIPFGTGLRNNVKIENIEVPQLSSEFVIDKKYTIPSNAKPYLVEVSKHNLNATFSHKAVPKLDNDAFLLANIVGWEDLNLIQGPTNVYYSNSFVGQSYINTRFVEDTLRLSFGRDKKVLVTRKKLEEFSDKKVIGNNRRDTYTFEITVKNNQNISLNMSLFDQVPISQESDITVTVNEISNAIHNTETGILEWKVKLNPGEAQKYKISFTIKYPKNKNIVVNKYRTVSCPSF